MISEIQAKSFRNWLMDTEAVDSGYVQVGSVQARREENWARGIHEIFFYSLPFSFSFLFLFVS